MHQVSITIAYIFHTIMSALIKAKFPVCTVLIDQRGQFVKCDWPGPNQKWYSPGCPKVTRMNAPIQRYLPIAGSRCYEKCGTETNIMKVIYQSRNRACYAEFYKLQNGTMDVMVRYCCGKCNVTVLINLLGNEQIVDQIII
ncbi:hypothetical protein FGIG_08098 [Fasciola gigantica]|uniref:Uncharacterized protein n=1 Tax=Fasciola gigantica TaxID=46835 RepID=A0A504YRC3_FASGI|nr:hypothetical protein FGIG_08098 [Fasciola gigantica]